MLATDDVVGLDNPVAAQNCSRAALRVRHHAIPEVGKAALASHAAVWDLTATKDPVQDEDAEVVVRGVSLDPRVNVTKEVGKGPSEAASDTAESGVELNR
jgi:hypothetical protein